MSRLHRRDDRGATLILVLIIVTVVGLVMGAVLLYAGTNLSSTVALRSKTGDTYSVDAAGNAALAQLKNGEMDCTSPGGTTAQLGSSGNPFYSADGGTSVNAAIRCTPDADDGAVTKTTVTKSGHGVTIDDGNLPDYALLALWRNSLTEGITSNGSLCVLNGNVASDGVINAATGTFGVRTGGCTSGSGGLTLRAHGTTGSNGCVRGTGRFAPTRCTALRTLIGRPAPPTPSDPITRVNPRPVCDPSGTYAAFLPGKYTNVNLLNSPCGGTARFEWFSPGTYYFDYGSTWNWPSTLLAGTPTSGPTTNNSDGSPNTPALTTIDPTQANTLAGLAQAQLPNACADPAAQKQYDGVQFVFGGSSQVLATGASAEICATYSHSETGTSPPVAIYGAPNAVNVTGGSVPRQSLCTPAGAPTTCTGPLLQFNGAEVYLNGYVFAPAGQVKLQSTNGNLFNWGAAVLTLDANAVPSSAPTVQRPAQNAGYTETTTTITVHTYKYVDVCVYPASSSPCDPSTSADLRIKVQYKDPAIFTDPGTKVITVLSWSAQS
jgi:hypothetical protein